MNLLSTLKALILGTSLVFSGFANAQVSVPQPECPTTNNIWYKVSTDDLTYGDVLRLDMRQGQAFSDPYYIYILVKEIDSGETTVIAFPNGGDWAAFSEQDSIFFELEGEIDGLNKYLKGSPSTEIKRSHP